MHGKKTIERPSWWQIPACFGASTRTSAENSEDVQNRGISLSSRQNSNRLCCMAPYSFSGVANNRATLVCLERMLDALSGHDFLPERRAG